MMPSIHPVMYDPWTGMETQMQLLQVLEQTPTGDIDREAFLEWLADQPDDWSAPGDSISDNPLGAWWHAQGIALVQVGMETAVLNGGTVDEVWVSLGDWGAAFLDACTRLAWTLHRSLSRAEVRAAADEADWACIEQLPTVALDREAILRGTDSAA